jgi:predicted nucleotidyltransferase
MQTTTEIENKLRQLKPILAKKYSVSKIGYFGSYANHEQNEQSDIDILVEFSKPIGWNFFTLEKFLEEQFGVKIDLITRNALKEQLRDTILQQVRFV